MPLEIVGLSALRGRLAALRTEETLVQALGAAAGEWASRMPDGPPVSAASDGLRAVIGSTDRDAVAQEMGTAHRPPSPFIAPAGAAGAERLAHAVAQPLAAALRSLDSGWRA